MTAPVHDESQWACDVAENLTQVYGSFADDAPDKRARFIVEEVNRAVKMVPVPYRAQYLDKLAQRFPIMEAPPVSPAPPAPESKPVDPKEVIDGAETGLIVEAFFKRLEGMSVAEKLALSKKLDALGVVAVKAVDSAAPAASKERKCLESILNTQVSLNTLVWKIWQEMAPQSKIRRESDLKKDATEYLKGNGEQFEALGKSLDKDRRLVVAILSAISLGAGEFARDHFERFCPDGIRGVVDQDRVFWNNKKEQYWNKYVELADEIRVAESIERKIKMNIAENAEKLLRV